MSILMSVDPGTCMGVAFFRNTILLEVGLVQGPSQEVTRTLFQLVDMMKPDEAIIEIPRVYTKAEKWKGNPQDLIKVAVIAGQALAAVHPFVADVELVTPSTWKGSRPKDLDNAYTLSKLQSVEKEILDRLDLAKTKKHNAVDAIGLGLWKLKRR